MPPFDTSLPVLAPAKIDTLAPQELATARDPEFGGLLTRCREWGRTSGSQSGALLAEIAALYERHRHHWSDFLRSHDVPLRGQRGPAPASARFQPVCKYLLYGDGADTTGQAAVWAAVLECWADAELPAADLPAWITAHGGSIRAVYDHSESARAESGGGYWLTPPELMDIIRHEAGGEVYDPCPWPRPPGFDGLAVPWRRLNYVNAPFLARDGNGKGPTPWIRKAIVEQERGNTTFLVLPAQASQVNLLVAAGAEIKPLGRIRWLHTHTGDPMPSPPSVTLYILRGKPTGGDGAEPDDRNFHSQITVDMAIRRLADASRPDEILTIDDDNERLRREVQRVRLGQEAQNRLAIANIRAAINLGSQSRPAKLGLTTKQTKRCRRFAALDSRDVNWYIDMAQRRGDDITSDLLLYHARRQRYRRARAQPGNGGDIADLLTCRVKYGTIVIDNAWPIEGEPMPYPELGIAEVAALLPIPALAATRCHLHIWCLPNHTHRQVYSLIAKWGFRPVGEFVWCKDPPLGQGNYWRHAHETLVSATNVLNSGDGFDDHWMPSYAMLPRRGHSVKPDEVLEMLERASPAPRLEIFARREREGWSTWGHGIETPLAEQEAWPLAAQIGGARPMRRAAATIHGQDVTPLLGKITVGDCLTIMRQIPNSVIKLIVTSPPYNILCSTGNGLKYPGGGKWQHAALADGYDGHDDAMPDDEYIFWQRDFLAEAMRVLRDDGAIFYVHKSRVLNGLWQDCFPILSGFPVRQEIIWQRSGGLNFNDGYFLPTCETIYLIAKPDFRLADGAHRLTDVWQIGQERDNPHPAPFPLELALRCIGAVDDGIVLDPFIGSGTTAIAAERLGRQWIGIEKSQMYADKANASIATNRGCKHGGNRTSRCC